MISWKYRPFVASFGSLAVGIGLSAGCLDRPIAPIKPHTSNFIVDRVIQDSIDKIDLLFLIDNSRSMADKQSVLRTAVPALLNRLITPKCADKLGELAEPDASGGCPPGFIREFKPVKDIHIGVVTSSLGGHGGTRCSGGAPTENDRAELLGTVRPTEALPSHQNLGFLAWGGTDGITDPTVLIEQFSRHVQAAGEEGCGFEATLEAWYRFLIDPEPPLDVVFDGSASQMTGVNAEILEQRAAFLRPDSLVAIVMLSDENDCSIQDFGAGYLVASSTHPTSGENLTMPHGTSECALDPNDPCCRSCGLVQDVPGCPPKDADLACQEAKTNRNYDAENLRCHAQKRRFGIDLLYPTSRYVNGLKDREVPGRDGSLKPNPLYVNPTGEPRDPSLVFLAGIVGVPWQDIATADTLTAPGRLRYLGAKDLTAQARWDVIVGDPTSFVEPTDPFMLERSEPRTGVNPVTQDPIVGPLDTNPRANPINGHEYFPHPPVTAPNPPVYDDLQYACIYPLPASRDCTSSGSHCDCTNEHTARNKPLCNPPTGGGAGTTQYFAKAYPGLRELEVLKDYALSAPDDQNSIVASICPKVLDDPTNADYGYNPAVRAIIDRLKVFLSGRCLPRELRPDQNGLVPCAVVEASKVAACDRPGRVPVSDLVADAVRKQLSESKACGDDCGAYELCEILPAGKSPDGSVDPVRLDACQMGIPLPDEVGYCYIDEARGIGKPELVQGCSPEERRMLRFIGEDTPADGALTFIACVGESLDDET